MNGGCSTPEGRRSLGRHRSKRENGKIILKKDFREAG